MRLQCIFTLIILRLPFIKTRMPACGLTCMLLHVQTTSWRCGATAHLSTQHANDVITQPDAEPGTGIHSEGWKRCTRHTDDRINMTKLP